MVRLRLLAIAFTACAAVLAAPSVVQAVTVDEIVALSRSGVSEAVILALLERDRTILSIAPDQIVSLKREGLSDSLITAMLKNGRAEGEEAARRVSEANAAFLEPSLALASVPPPPVVVVGHGPDRPDTARSSTIPDGGFVYGGTFVAIAPPFLGGARLRSRQPPYKSKSSMLPVPTREVSVPPLGFSDPPALCVAQVNTAKGPVSSYVTECPPFAHRKR